MSGAKKALYLIDSYGLIYRSYFAFMSRPLRNNQGQNVSALFGFFRSVAALLNEGAPSSDGSLQKPACLAAVFDSRVPTFRHERYPAYKANRQKTPEDLHAQVPLVEEALASLGVPCLRADRFEADDIIATLARRCADEGRECYIISSDKDLLQLVGNGTFELRPGKGSTPNSGANLDLIGPAEVKAEWGVGSDRILDILSLTGDSSDNVGGVKGIGDKTAVKLIARYGDLDGIYANLSGIEGAVGTKLAQGREDAYFSRSLIELAYNAPIDVASLDDLSVEKLNRAACAGVLLREGLRQVAAAFDPSVVKVGEEPVHKAGKGQASARPLPGAEASGMADAAVPLRPNADPTLRMEGRYAAILSTEELEKTLSKAKKQGFMALDFETDSLEAWKAHPIGFSLALEPGKGFYIPVARHAPPSGELGLEDAPTVDAVTARELLAPLLADPDFTVVAHNAKYDYEVSRAWGLPRWNCHIWDTMVAAWLIDGERSSFALDSLVANWLSLPTIPFDSIVPKGSTFASVPLETAVRYSGEDADYTLRLKALIEPVLRSASMEGLFVDLEMKVLPILAEMEGAGIRLESRVLTEYGVTLAAFLEKIQADIWALVGHEFNIASTKQLQEVLFVERKLKSGKKTKTGFSTDVAVLEELAREDPVPALILRYRSLAKLKSTYVDALATEVGEDGRLHTHFIQTGTATGRLSSRDPNLQNIPIRDEEGRQIRRAFVASPGRVLVSADYSQIELVVLAHLSKDPALSEAFKTGMDVHRRTASLIFGIGEAEVTSDQRRIAKTINFGVMYGMSAFRLSNELGISRTEAQSFIDAYFSTYAGIRDFIQATVEEVERTGYATTLLGRRRYIPAIRSGNKTEKAGAERVAVNTPIQGTAADIVKLAMIRVDRALGASGLDARLLLQVHDELILECAEADAPRLIALMKKEMEDAVTLSIPLRASVESAQSWGDLH